MTGAERHPALLLIVCIVLDYSCHLLGTLHLALFILTYFRHIWRASPELSWNQKLQSDTLEGSDGCILEGWNIFFKLRVFDILRGTIKSALSE